MSVGQWHLQERGEGGKFLGFVVKAIRRSHPTFI